MKTRVLNSWNPLLAAQLAYSPHLYVQPQNIHSGPRADGDLARILGCFALLKICGGTQNEDLTHRRNVLLRVSLFCRGACVYSQFAESVRKSRSAPSSTFRAESLLTPKQDVRGSSRFMGLSWHRGVKKWAVQLRIENQNRLLGYFSNELEGAVAHDHFVILTRPPDARTNFPRPLGGGGYDLSKLMTSSKGQGRLLKLEEAFQLQNPRKLLTKEDLWEIAPVKEATKPEVMIEKDTAPGKASSVGLPDSGHDGVKFLKTGFEVPVTLQAHDKGEVGLGVEGLATGTQHGISEQQTESDMVDSKQQMEFCGQVAPRRRPRKPGKRQLLPPQDESGGKKRRIVGDGDLRAAAQATSIHSLDTAQTNLAHHGDKQRVAHAPRLSRSGSAVRKSSASSPGRGSSQQLVYSKLGIGKGGIHDHVNTRPSQPTTIKPCRRSKRKSRFQGVRHDAKADMWVAELRYHGQTTNLGSFKAELEAAQAYDNAGKMLDGHSFPSNLRSDPEFSQESTYTSTDIETDSSSSDCPLGPPLLPRWGRVVRARASSARRADLQAGPRWKSRMSNLPFGSGTVLKLPPESSSMRQAESQFVDFMSQPRRPQPFLEQLSSRFQKKAPQRLVPAQAVQAQNSARDSRHIHYGEYQLPIRQAPAASSAQIAFDSKALHTTTLVGGELSVSKPVNIPVLKGFYVLEGLGKQAHLASNDPATKSTVSKALHRPENAPVLALAIKEGTPEDYLYTLPREVRDIIVPASGAPNFLLSAVEIQLLLSVIGLDIAETREPGTFTLRGSLQPLRSADLPGLIANYRSSRALPDSSLHCSSQSAVGAAIQLASGHTESSLQEQHLPSVAPPLIRGRVQVDHSPQETDKVANIQSGHPDRGLS